MGEDVAVGMMKAGAHDYLIKDHLARLAPAVEREVREAHIRQERRQAEESLRLALIAAEEANHRYHLVADQSRTIIWEVDAAGYVYVCQPRVGSGLRLSPEELIAKKHFCDLHPDEGREDFKSRGARAPGAAAPFLDFENAVRTKDGRTVWVSTNGIPVLNDRGELVGYRGSSTDITERKRAQAALRASEERYRLISENTADVIWLVDLSSGQYTYVSPSVQHCSDIPRKKSWDRT